MRVNLYKRRDLLPLQQSGANADVFKLAHRQLGRLFCCNPSLKKSAGFPAGVAAHQFGCLSKVAYDGVKNRTIGSNVSSTESSFFINGHKKTRRSGFYLNMFGYDGQSLLEFPWQYDLLTYFFLPLEVIL